MWIIKQAFVLNWFMTLKWTCEIDFFFSLFFYCSFWWLEFLGVFGNDLFILKVNCVISVPLANRSEKISQTLLSPLSVRPLYRKTGSCTPDSRYWLKHKMMTKQPPNNPPHTHTHKLWQSHSACFTFKYFNSIWLLTFKIQS